MTCSQPAKDLGRFGLWCTSSTSSSSLTNGVFHTSMLCKLPSTCSFHFLEPRRHKRSSNICLAFSDVIEVAEAFQVSLQR
mmetsp:Transcript_8123/g.12731  ORF Transcript_8123/g.12731 Transcript_8123/m.12731 type:complete len:80 (-) Transcript_8123:186-425(-)